jgi:hypothetical protein
MTLELRYSWKTDKDAGADTCQIAAEPPRNEAELRAIEIEVIGIAARRLNVDEVEVLIVDWQEISNDRPLTSLFSQRRSWR